MRKTASKLLIQSAHDPFSECVLWTGAQNSGGYGYLRVAKGELPELPRVSRVHRVAYWLLRGAFDLELTVDHLCHNRLCVNPYHLQVISCSDNSTEGANYRWHGETLDEWEADNPGM